MSLSLHEIIRVNHLFYSLFSCTVKCGGYIIVNLIKKATVVEGVQCTVEGAVRAARTVEKFM